MIFYHHLCPFRDILPVSQLFALKMGKNPEKWDSFPILVNNCG